MHGNTIAPSGAARWWSSIVACAAMLLLQACGGGGGGATAAASGEPRVSASQVTARAPLSDAARMGEQIFFDPSLSASGRLACVSCHAPGRAHAPANALAVQLGGADGNTPGLRAAPSLRYRSLIPAFSIGADGIARGGLDADGRADTLAAQAARPLLAAHEMANDSKASLVARLRRTVYADAFRAAFGAGVFDDVEVAFDRATFALQEYQRELAELAPFDSKFDLSRQNKAVLSAAELRGLALFNNPAKGNCAACHTSAATPNGTPPLFSTFGYYNLGVPRGASAPPGYDLGLCGPERTDLRERAALCGAFRVPPLRNVATREVFFHNGAIRSLREAVAFHVRRDTHPQEWYPAGADGKPQRFNDLPPEYRGNVLVSIAPFDRRPGAEPALSAAEIDDVVQFLGTLTDGYKP